MSLPPSVAGFLAALFLAAAALCVASLWRRRARHERAAAASEANHIVMSVGMAAMVLPATTDLVPPLAGALAFGALGVVWAVRLVALRARGRPLGSAIGGDRCAAHPTHLLLSNAAMAVMYVAMVPSAGAVAGTGGHAGHGGHGGGAGSPLALQAAAFALAVYLILHTVLTVGALVRSTTTVAVTAGGGGASVGLGTRVGRVVDAPAVQLGCQAVTGAGMALMLLVH